MRNVRIASTGCFTPPGAISNDELIERFGLDIDSEWIVSRTGIESRHWLEPGLATSDMAAEAARSILEGAGLPAKDLDRIVLATITPDYPSPATATLVARKIGARCAAFDLSAACAGFIYGLEMGAAAIRGGDRNVLVLGADTRSRFVDTEDRRATVLFADGAGGALLQASEEPGFLAFDLGAEGRSSMGAYVPAGGSLLPASEKTVAEREHFVHVDGRNEIFDLFVRFSKETCGRALEKSGKDWSDVDLLITHQGNEKMVDALTDALDFPRERAINNIVHHGNTAGASVPIALSEAFQANRIQDGDLVLLTSVGAGYTFGAALHQF